MSTHFVVSAFTRGYSFRAAAGQCSNQSEHSAYTLRDRCSHGRSSMQGLSYLGGTILHEAMAMALGMAEAEVAPIPHTWTSCLKQLQASSAHQNQHMLTT